MKTISRFMAVLGMLALSSTAFALSIGPGDANWQGDLPNNPDANDIECIVNGDTVNGQGTQNPNDDVWNNGCVPSGDFDELYKENVGDGFDTGPYSDDYVTTFTGGDPNGFDIVFGEGSNSIDCSVEGCYLLVKDGNNSPIWYLFDISTWNGTETITGTGFWTGNGGISHVSIFGGEGTTDMPEPGTLALLGLGLFGMGVMRRRRR